MRAASRRFCKMNLSESRNDLYVSPEKKRKKFIIIFIIIFPLLILFYAKNH
jgi:hypothetical protein